jgi:hypothetical protein
MIHGLIALKINAALIGFFLEKFMQFDFCWGVCACTNPPRAANGIEAQTRITRGLSQRKNDDQSSILTEKNRR